MANGPFEYRAYKQPLLGGGSSLLKRQEHREKLLRTPLRVLKNSETVEDNDEEESDLNPIPNPERNFDCVNYETCLNLTAALNWQSFTCKGCDCTINPALLKKAERAMHDDNSLEPLIGNFTSKK